MFQIPAFNFIRHHPEYSRDLYEAMDKNDMSEVVMTAYDILKKRLNLSCTIKENLKSEEHSNILRIGGNRHFSLGKYGEAFLMYNIALAVAPKDSKAMKLAYSNKSALFFKLERYQECINDIDKCFSLNCPKDLVSKLVKRKEDAKRLLQPEDTSLDGDCLNLKSLLNQTPYISKYINITEESNRTNVATTNIKVGTIVAIEEAFVSNVSDFRSGFCYFCQKKSLNLVPCDNCCHVLFCSENCKNVCMMEYHKIECDIMDLLSILTVAQNLMFKSVIRLMLKGTWEELIEISNNIESNKKQFDPYSRFSVLNLRGNKPFKFGRMYNASIICATLIGYLETIPSIFPESPMKRLQAMRALGRIMMFIVLNCKPRLIFQSIRDVPKKSIFYSNNENYGLYPLFENFKQSCEHNTAAVFSKNKMLLIAIKPIESGSEITIPYIMFDYQMEQLQDTEHVIHSFKYNHDVCKMCANNTHTPKNKQELVLSWQQQEVVNQTLSLLAVTIDELIMNSSFSRLCETLTILSVSQSHNFKNFCEYFLNFVHVFLLRLNNNMKI